MAEKLSKDMVAGDSGLSLIPQGALGCELYPLVCLPAGKEAGILHTCTSYA